jgi:hypothetical protein
VARVITLPQHSLRMNTKKIIGLLLWVVAFAIPFKFALLNTEEVDNITGLVGFVVFLALVFTGYALVDSSSASSGEHGH